MFLHPIYSYVDGNGFISSVIEKLILFEKSTSDCDDIIEALSSS